MAYSTYKYMKMNGKFEESSLPCIPQCKICSELKDPDVPKLTCGHYICPPCYINLKSLKRDNCILCDRKMKIRCPRY